MGIQLDTTANDLREMLQSGEIDESEAASFILDRAHKAHEKSKFIKYPSSKLFHDITGIHLPSSKRPDHCIPNSIADVNIKSLYDNEGQAGGVELSALETLREALITDDVAVKNQIIMCLIETLENSCGSQR